MKNTVMHMLEENVRRFPQKTALADDFDEVADGTMITRTKPDPEVFVLAAELVDTAPENCLVVEDAEAGIKAAKAGGMKAAAYKEAAACGLADYEIEDLRDLVKILSN